MIKEATDYKLLYRISRLVDSGVFKGIDYTGDEFFRYLIDKFDEDRVKVFVSIKEDKLNKLEGFAICSLVKGDIREVPQVLIRLAYVDKKAGKDTGEKLMNKIEAYAGELKVDEVCGYSLRGTKSMYKRYGFNLDYKCYIKKLEKREKREKREKKREVNNEGQERRDKAPDSGNRLAKKS
jgi:DNA-binding Lrp family transcriptional regulator